jgi:uncharacterized protein YdhG (YjbR/CyaY superfamily)
MPQTVESYLAAQPHEARQAIERLRAIVRKLVPEAHEAISYRILAYKLGGRILLYIAGWKEHVAIYPVTPGLDEALGERLAPYRSGKGTLRFPLSQPLPIKLIENIVRVRVEEAGKAAARRRS